MDPKQTAIHGDFHRGNLFFRPGAEGADGDCAVIDWSFYGTGHCCWELLYFFKVVWASREGIMDLAEEQRLLRLCAHHHPRSPPTHRHGCDITSRRL